MSDSDNDLVNRVSDDILRSVKLLLLLSRTEFSDDERQMVSREFESFTSWKLFASQAVRHGVAALVWQNISDMGLANRVPDTERSLLENLRFKSIARVAWITEAAAGATALLEREGIRVLVLKGLALEHTVYGSRGLRQMSDADLLVAPSDALRARDILVREGFRSMHLKSPLYKQIILDLGNHLPELHRGGVSVDLHFRLFGPEAGGMVNRAITDAVTVMAGKETFRVLPPMTNFLALVSHIYKHSIKGEFQLRLWVDIYLLLTRYGSEILTEDLPAAAKEAGITGETRSVLAVIEQVWGIKIPAEMKAHMDEGRNGGEAPTAAMKRKHEGNNASGADSKGNPAEDTMPATAADSKDNPAEDIIHGPPADRGEAVAARFMHDLMHPGSVVPLSQREFFARNLRSLKSPWKKLIFIIGDIFPSVGFMKHRYGCRSTFRALLFYPHRFGKLAWILGLPETGDRDI